MLIDGFTVIAQIINFLILVFLLKRFLYGPITQAMAKRKAEVQRLLDGAAEERAIAQQEKAAYQAKQQALEQEREALLAQIKTEVAIHKQHLLTQAEAEVEALRQRWQKGLAQDQQVLTQSLQHRLNQTLTQTVREILTDLTDTHLENQLALVFMERLRQLPAQDRDRLQQALDHPQANSMTIATSFALSPDLCQTLTHQVQQQFGPSIPVQFEQIDHDVLDIELRMGGYRLTWGMMPYLTKLQTELTQCTQNYVSKYSYEPTTNP